MPLDLDPGSVPVEPPPASPGAQRPRAVVPWLLALVLVALAAGGAYWYLSRSAPVPAPAVAASAPAPAPATTPVETPAPPVAEASLHGDALIRDWASRLFDGLDARWTEGGDLARRIAGALFAVADGESPRAFLTPLVPRAAFTVDEQDGQTTITAASFARYDWATRQLSTLHVDRVAQAWAAIRPAVEVAWREIAPPSSKLEEALDRAVGQLLAAPVIDAPLHLVSHGAIYQFADPRLEALPAVQKLLVRMGPANERIVQAQARKVGRALGLPSAR